MTMKPLPLFWNALEALPGAATDRRDWAFRLGAEFPLVRGFLRATGRRATALDCPSPGGEGCPRAVVKSADGALRAVCRSKTGRCDPLDLTPEETDILQVDFARLRQALAAAFEVQMAADVSPGRIALLGDHAIAAGVAAPVMMVVPGPFETVTLDALRDAGLGNDRAILLIPTATSLPMPIRARLASLGHLVLTLCDVTAVDDKGHLIPVQPLDLLLRDIREALHARLGTVERAPAIALAPGTRWPQLTLRLTSTETVIASASGVARQMDPADFGMRSKKNAKPIAAWALLVALAATKGVLQPQRPALAESVKKQKQILAGHLRKTFGLPDDPLPWDPRRGAYVAAFVISDERSKREREAMGRR